MIWRKEYLKKNYIKLLVPICVVLVLAYLNYAINYAVGYKLVYVHHSHAVAIILWVLLGFFQLELLVYWVLIFLVGPGKSPVFPPIDLYSENNKGLIPLPDLFFCDEKGFPYYCSNSNSIKLERSFFSKDVGYNVIKFDHYCIWIGQPIGQDNYLFFMKFMMGFLAFFIIVLIYCARFTRESIQQGEIDHNFIVLFVMSGFWIIMIGCLFGIHLRYVSINMTTLDEITINQRKRYNRWKDARKNPNMPSWMKTKNPPRKETGRKYVNLKHKTGRAIVRYYIDERPFDMGFRRNWINLVFNGNRNHGKDDEFYTLWRLAAAFVVFIIPFIDIPFSFRGKLQVKDDVEQELHEQENLLAKYTVYSSVVNDKFMNMIDEKLKKNSYSAPGYLVETTPQNNQSTIDKDSI